MNKSGKPDFMREILDKLDKSTSIPPPVEKGLMLAVQYWETGETDKYLDTISSLCEHHAPELREYLRDHGDSVPEELRHSLDDELRKYERQARP